MYHSEVKPCTLIRCCPREITIISTFKRLTEVNILDDREKICSTGFKYGLKTHLISQILEEPFLDIPKTPFCHMYSNLDDTTTKTEGENKKLST